MSIENKEVKTYLKYVDTVYTSLVNTLEGEITPLNLAMITLNLMQMVEHYKDLTGSDKKALVVEVLERWRKEHNESLNLDILPSVIDTFVSLDKGELQVKVNISSCLECCFPSFRKNKK